MSDERPQAGIEPGDPRLADHLFATHYLPVMRLCMRHLRDVDDAEDAVQETFRRAVQHGAALHGDPLPWLITVAKHVCLDELRRRRAGQTALERTPSPGTAAADAAGDNPERLVVGHLFVRELLGRLTPAERRVLAARVYEGRTSADTAGALGVSSTTTRVLLARARTKLRAYLENGQAAFAGLPLLFTRALHDARRRLLERPWLSEQARAVVLLPAAVLLTVGMSPGSAVALPQALGVNRASPPSATHAAAPGGAGDGASPTQRSLPSPSLWQERHPSATPTTPGSDRTETPVVPALVADPGAMTPYDIEPSPDYQSDHTVYMLGDPWQCFCSELFRSTDSGLTWHYVGTPPLNDNTILLPSTTAQGRFYAMGMGQLQMTIDDGKLFVAFGPPLVSYAAVAPAWANLDLLYADQTGLWHVGEDGIPRMMGSFQHGEQAVGPPVVMPDKQGHPLVLLPVSFTDLTGAMRFETLGCDPTCGTWGDLVFEGVTQELVLSPNVAVDHTVFEVLYGMRLAVSHDDGHTFSPVSSTPVLKLKVIPSPRGLRLVAVTEPSSGVMTSDDDGATWQAASIAMPGLTTNAPAIGVVAPGRLIALFSRRAAPTNYEFACSTDGGSWQVCSP